MKAALSTVLAVLLVALPVTQVLAQSAPQDTTTADASFPTMSRARPVSGTVKFFAPVMRPESGNFLPESNSAPLVTYSARRDKRPCGIIRPWLIRQNKPRLQALC